MLFVKYVSDKYAGDANALIEIPKGGSFADMVKLKNDKEIGDKINKLIGRLADANESLKGAINVADFNDEEKLGKGKEMVDRLTKLVAIFEGLDFGGNRAGGTGSSTPRRRFRAPWRWRWCWTWARRPMTTRAFTTPPAGLVRCRRPRSPPRQDPSPQTRNDAGAADRPDSPHLTWPELISPTSSVDIRFSMS